MNPVRMLLAAAFWCAVLPVFADEQAPESTPGPAIDRRSERVLLDACGYLRAAGRFSVESEVSYEDILTSGTRVEYHRQARIVLERPNHLRIDSDSDKGRRSFFYDGKTLTVYYPDRGVYASAPAPDSIDAMIAAVETRGIVMPASDLLLDHPCEALGERLQSGTYAGRHYLEGDWYHHLLLSSAAVDVQLWVAEGEAPVIRRLVITYARSRVNPSTGRCSATGTSIPPSTRRPSPSRPRRTRARWRSWTPLRNREVPDEHRAHDQKPDDWRIGHGGRGDPAGRRAHPEYDRRSG